ncbi:MAG: protein kinase [Deltaproteobacteria bacterium]|nr:protein kinase [Deltaproteobacteria bacterium]
MSAKTDLLFGVLGVQLGLLTPRQVMSAGAEWASDRERGLAERIEESGEVTPEICRMLKDMVADAIQAHGGDSEKTLQALGGDQAVLLSFGGLSHVTTVESAKRSEGCPEPSTVDFEEDMVTVTAEHPGRYNLCSKDASQQPGDKDAAEIGRGGIGRVLVAFDDHLGREVAIKELLPELALPDGQAASMQRMSSVVVRFLREARITGQLEHPNIVPVYELGRRKDGSLYYSMKLVRGRTLSLAIADCRGLADRLKLLTHFSDICHAVAYAHSRGIIHRDIKPENVMLGEFGETVVLDWGLAKVRGQVDLRGTDLKEDLLLLRVTSSSKTEVGAIMGTPLYMSPEQAFGEIEAIDERSDVWSLGAVLYEILTGQPPFEGTNSLEVLGKVMSGQLRPARSLCPELPPELGAIAEKALQKDQAARYQDARKLASEIEAYLTGDRVKAHEYSSWALIKRLIDSNRLAFAVGVVGTLLLAIVLGVSLRRIAAERDQAQVQRQSALTFANYLVSDLLPELANSPESTETRKAVLDRSLRYYEAEVDPDSGDANERLDLARAYNQVGHLSLVAGNIEGGLKASRIALRILKDLKLAAPKDPKILLLQADTNYTLARGLLRTSKGSEAMTLLRGALAQAKEAAGPSSNSVETTKSISQIELLIGNLLCNQGKLSQARTMYADSMKEAKRLTALAPRNVNYLFSLACTYDALALVSKDLGQMQASREFRQQDLAVLEKIMRLAPSNPRWKRGYASSLDWFGMLEFSMGNSKAALEQLRRAVAMADLTAGIDPTNKIFANTAARCEMHLGQVLERSGQAEEARRNMRRALERYERLLVDAPKDVVFSSQASYVLDLLAELELSGGHLTEARGLLDRALSYDLQLVAARPKSEGMRLNVALSHARLSDLAATLGDFPSAQKYLDTQLRMAEALLEGKSGNSMTVQLLAESLGRALRLALSQGKREQSRALSERYRETVLRLLQLGPDDQELKGVAVDEGMLRGDLESIFGHAKAAAAAYSEAKTLAQSMVKKDPKRMNARLSLARLQWRLGEFKEAVETLRRLRRQDPEDLKVLTELIQVELLAGHVRAAFTLGEQALERNPDSRNNRIVLLAMMASAQFQSGQSRKARRTAQQALSLAESLVGPLSVGDWQLAVLWTRLEARLPGELRALWRALREWNLGSDGNSLAKALRQFAG